MPEFTLVREVKVGDLLTAGSVLLGTVTLLYALLKDRSLRRREYADRIRRSAADTLAAMERWREIALRHFHDAQPLLTDADLMLVKDQDVVLTRDFLWRALVALEAQSSARVLAEKLEGAYAGLYGYDPSVHQTYASSVARMREAFEAAHLMHLERTQRDVLGMNAESQPYTSAQLGNRLRESTFVVVQDFLVRAEEAVAPLRAQMLALIEASDSAIVYKRLVETRQNVP
jgi:hypothetical protein